MSEIKDSFKITGYVGGLGFRARIPVKLVSITNINLALNLVGTSIDSVVLATDDRILLVGQTTGTENGIYVVGTTTVRAPDFEIGDDVSNVFVAVTAGTVYANSEWQAVSSGSSSVVGTGTLNFLQKNFLSYAIGDIIYPNSTRTLAKLTKPSSITSVFSMTSAGVPSWNPFNLNAPTPTTNDALIYNGTQWANTPYPFGGIIYFNSGGNVISGAYFTHGTMNATISRGTFIAGKVAAQVTVAPISGTSWTLAILKNGSTIASSLITSGLTTTAALVNVAFNEFDNYAVTLVASGVPPATVGYCAINYRTNWASNF